ncbi:MAG: hypothetical protein AB1659_03440 [Thermodesulfobacteriota bacterium]
MDSHFLEFLGNLLISGAKGMETLKPFAQWMNQGMKGVETISTLFQKCYGIKEPQPDPSDESNRWEASIKEFTASYREFLTLLGVVPIPIHLELQKKCRAQEKTILEQKELISDLKQKLYEKESTDSKTDSKTFSDLMENQSDQFQKMIETLQTILKPKSGK